MLKKRSKRTSRPTEGLVVRHEGGGGAARWFVVILLPLTMAASAVAYRFYIDTEDLKAQLEDIPRLQAEQLELNNALTTERLRGNALEKDLVSVKARNEQALDALDKANVLLRNQPKPVFDTELQAGGIDLVDFKIQKNGGSKHSVTLTVTRSLDVAGESALPDVGRSLGHVSISTADLKSGNVRLVVIPKDESNGKRVYLPQKSWRRSEGFKYSLNAGEKQTFSGELDLPESFEPGSVRLEIFTNEPVGGYTLNRIVSPWKLSN